MREMSRRLEEKERQLGDNRKRLESISDKARQQEESARKLDELQIRLDEALEENEKLRVALIKAKPSESASAAIIADANAEADRIRAVAIDEKERVRRQIRSSAGGLAESVSNLRVDVTGVENNVTTVLESVQTALADIMNALGRTEQNLTTLGVQVERFPAQSAAVPKYPQQQVVYFQPNGQQPSPAPTKRRRQPDSFGTGGFRRITSETAPSAARPFKPAYSSAQAWPNTMVAEEPENERVRALAENLADTLVDTISEMLI